MKFYFLFDGYGILIFGFLIYQFVMILFGGVC